MAGNSRKPPPGDDVMARRRRLRSFQELDAGDGELASALEQISPSSFRSPHRQRPEPSSSALESEPQQVRSLFGSPIAEQTLSALPTTAATGSPVRNRGSRRPLGSRARRRGGRELAPASPSRASTPRRRGSLGLSSTPFDTSQDRRHASRLHFHERDLAADEAARNWTEDEDMAAPDWISSPADSGIDDWEDLNRPRELEWSLLGGPHLSGSDAATGAAIDPSRLPSASRFFNGVMKHSRDRHENVDTKNFPHLMQCLKEKGAVAVVLYNNAAPNPAANDIWPECRSEAKLPSHYFRVDLHGQTVPRDRLHRCPPSSQVGSAPDEINKHLPDAPVGRPQWNLPVELVELIADHLNRDDIKSLRLVSRELNYFVSQVIFKTVVVPFNTEIYGMLGQEPKPDFKGKRRAKVESPRYLWKNANGDDVYNGHGLDVFRGFGKHILSYGMSFEVNEDSLAMPPVKSVTERKTTFWGNYDWPFEEYRRFDAVAGLESAADETPRMKIAFSELTKVKNLALSIDSGLGWLCGPDRSIRARLLQKPPTVFGCRKDIPDRQAQAQRELWTHIEAAHQTANSNIKLATLYRMEGQRPLSQLKEVSTLAEEQPDMPYLDPRLIHGATPHDAADAQVPASFDDPDVLDRFVLAPCSSRAGILFSSLVQPTDAGQLMSPIIPTNLTKAQKEWLLETEWAQRAFMSSYMLSIIDNSATFNNVQTLNISRIPDRYIPMLSRSDFWDALPALNQLTLIVIPGWRTVHKDEAGFVETPRINPLDSVEPFSDLLWNHIARRPNIGKLTIGWLVGGEHAEGQHARNRLIMPAPLTRSNVDGENRRSALELFVENDVDQLKASLLHFPHVEQLELKNCWIPPPALRQFVKIQDSHKLKELVFNSVSLTATLRLPGNANAVPQQPPVPNAAPALAFQNHGGAPAVVGVQVVPHNQQFLQIYIQSLQAQLHQLQQLQANGTVQQQTQITALQNQLQQQVQQLQTQNPQQALVPLLPFGNVQVQQHQQALPQPLLHHHHQYHGWAQIFAAHHQHHPAVQPPPVPANAQHLPDPQSVLKAKPRPGSWMDIIDNISPGTNLSDFESEYSQADSERITSLKLIEFISCGYVKLPHTSFDQNGIEFNNGLAAALRNPFFTKRHIALAPAMMNAKWAHLGEIVQEVDPNELRALDVGWDLKTGWKDEEAAQAVEFDGLLPGGTGRFSGIIRQSDRVFDAASASFDDFVGEFEKFAVQECL